MMDAETQEIFRQEAEALMESLQAGLLTLQSTPSDQALIDSVFRDLHTIKGTGAMFGFTRLAEFVHGFEAAFETVRSGKAVASPDLINVALRAYDLIAALLEGEDPDIALDKELTHALKQVTSGASDTADGPAPAETADADEPAGDGAWQLEFRLPEDFMEIGGNPLAMLDELREIGGEDTEVIALVDRIPAIEALETENLHLGWRVVLPADVAESAIRDVFMFHEDQMELALTRSAAAQPAAPEAAPTPTPEAPAPTGDTAASRPAAPAASGAQVPGAEDTKKTTAPSTQLRVSAERVDLMMDRVGELVIAEARLAAIADKLKDEGLTGVVEDIQRLALGLRDSTMALRMTPLSSIMGRFRRLCHDLGGSTGKAFDFIVEGEETELDKTVVEKLTDPLVHMLRNAVDHGLEDPETRVAAGKPARGKVTLSARHAGAEVLIQIVDDGRGMNEEKIRERALERGLITENSEMARGDILKLVLEPGFSTAEQVTALSGRGVGADVVKRAIEALSGSIDITSEPGQGTVFTLRLPLTLAIIEGLLIEVAGERYAIPLSAVEQILELPEHLKGTDTMSSVLEMDQELVPILRLRKIFGSTGERDPRPKIVIVSANGARVGLIVHRIIGTNQTVIKQLSPLHSRLKIFSGATILGDGCVALILDVGNLISRSQTLEHLEKERAA